MGKETKIGLGIIGVLGVIFAAVLVQRVTGSKDAEVAVEGTRPSTSSKSPPDKKHEDADKRPSSPKTPTFSQPTVITPRPGPSRHDGRRDSGTWAVISDDGKPGTTSNTASSAPPSFMPPTDMTSTNGHARSPLSPMPDAGPSPSDPAARVVSRPPPSSRDLFLGPPEHPNSATDRTPAPPPRGYAPGYPENTNPTSDATSREPNYQRHGAYDGAPLAPRRGQDHAVYPTQSGNADVLQGPYEPAPVAQKAARQYDSDGRSGRHRGGSAVESGGATVRPDGTYVVQPNDSFWVISKNLYGTGAYFKALAEYNRAKYRSEDTLRVGDTIKAPEVSELEEKYPDLCPSPERRQAVRSRASIRSASTRLAGERVYTVEEGDTLYDIARYKLGRGARWPEIYELNRETLQDNFDYLTPGMKLLLPETSDAPGTVTRRPDALNPR